MSRLHVRLFAEMPKESFRGLGHWLSLVFGLDVGTMLALTVGWHRRVN